MAKENKFVVDGYTFTSEDIADQAQKEVNGIRYVRTKLNNAKPEDVLSVYNRIIREHIFSTQVGYDFLVEIRDSLLKESSINQNDILPIDFKPLVKKFSVEDQEEDEIKPQPVSPKKHVEKVVAVKEKPVKKERQKERSVKKSKKIKAKKVERWKEKFSTNKNDNNSLQLKTSRIINLILGALVVLMLLLMINSSTPTIIDYENKLINKYEEWQKDLERREEIIKEYEEKYKIQDGFNVE